MPEQMTAASLKHSVERSRLDSIIKQALYVYQQMEDGGATEAVALTELVLNRFDDGVRP